MRKFIFIACTFFIIACNSKDQSSVQTLHTEAFGSTLDITLIGEKQVHLEQDIQQFLADFNASASTYDKESLISIYNRSGKATDLDSLNLELITTGYELFQKSEGAYDLAIGQLVNAWGFGFKNVEQMDSAKVDSIRKEIGFEQVTINGDRVIKKTPYLSFDFNSLAPGYAADRIGVYLESKGIQRYLVNVGGELVAKGTNKEGKPWLIGIEKPIENSTGVNPFEVLIALNDEALATSGNYRKFYIKDGKRYTHTVDPRTGYPVEHDLLSATVVGPKGIYCDALATCCMIMGREEAKAFLKQHYPDYRYYFIYDNGEAGFAVEFSEALASQLTAVQ